VSRRPTPIPIATANPHYDSDEDDDEDDEDDDEEEEPEEEGGEQVKKEGEVKSEVKAEPGTSKRKYKDANELHIYLEDELKLLKQDQLHADVQLLDGACVAATYTLF